MLFRSEASRQLFEKELENLKGFITSSAAEMQRLHGTKGGAALAAGIAVRENLLQPEAKRVNAGFLKRVTQGLPFVTLKLATTLDGRIATASGESRWITGGAARRSVHALRLNHDAVMVGSGTACADDPDLTVRDLGAQHQPVRIVLDSRLRHSPNSRLGKTANTSPVWLLHGPDAPAAARLAWAETGATLIETRCIDGQLDATAALQALAARGLTRILSEGGGTLAASLIRAKLVDDLALYQGGKLIGGDGQASLASLGLTALADAPQLTLRNTTQQAMKVVVTPRATLLDLPAQTVDIPAGDAREVSWRVTAPAQLASTRNEAILWEIEAKDTLSGARDAFKASQRIIPAVPLTVQQATLMQLDGPLTLNVAPPADALPGRGGLRMALQPQ